MTIFQLRDANSSSIGAENDCFPICTVYYKMQITHLYMCTNKLLTKHLKNLQLVVSASKLQCEASIRIVKLQVLNKLVKNKENGQK